MTTKFRAAKPARGSSLWYADLGNGAWVSYGWSYSANGAAFCNNQATYCHAWAHVDFHNAAGERTHREELFHEIVRGCRTYARARVHVKDALARARDAAHAAVPRLVSKSPAWERADVGAESSSDPPCRNCGEAPCRGLMRCPPANETTTKGD